MSPEFRCRLCRRPLLDETIIVFLVYDVGLKGTTRNFVDADNRSVVLSNDDFLCNHCILEAKVCMLHHEPYEHWAQDYRATLLGSNEAYDSADSSSETDYKLTEDPAYLRVKRYLVGKIKSYWTTFLGRIINSISA
ncbi:Hypothetical predicted protein [Cloeon dipterum]|uniref:Uncharacterized protein n=1 Tax=Cloeon dipterum TaxID=197152 RepID=A0A8S1CS78_9INSE|nr:Hypothetical predicted protein [Cloeon dipterum]